MVIRLSKVAWLNLEIYWSVCKKIEESFVLKKCCDWIIFSQVPQFEQLHCD